MALYHLILNKDASIHNGDKIICASKMQALNVASSVVRAYYNMGVYSAHVFVVENVDTVKYHYEIIFEKNFKQILLYEGICNNRKTIAKQVI